VDRAAVVVGTMTARAADDLRQLADRVARLTPDWRDMRRFYEARSEVAAQLRRSARALASAEPQRDRRDLGNRGASR
jgi:hypothetical protein